MPSLRILKTIVHFEFPTHFVTRIGICFTLEDSKFLKRKKGELEGAKRVSHFEWCVVRTLKIRYEKDSCCGISSTSDALDEFLPVMTSPTGHFRIDIHSNSLRNEENKLNAYVTEPIRIVEERLVDE